MELKVAFGVLGAIAVSGGLAVAAPNTPLSAADLQAELFGVHLFGIETDTGLRWDECIEADGRTVYRVQPPFGQAPYSEDGLLEVTPDGMACFSYPPGADPAPSCFRAMRRGEGYIFLEAGGGPGVFITTRVERGKGGCPKPGDLIG